MAESLICEDESAPHCPAVVSQRAEPLVRRTAAASPTAAAAVIAPRVVVVPLPAQPIVSAQSTLAVAVLPPVASPPVASVAARALLLSSSKPLPESLPLSRELLPAAWHAPPVTAHPADPDVARLHGWVSAVPPPDAVAPVVDVPLPEQPVALAQSTDALARLPLREPTSEPASAWSAPCPHDHAERAGAVPAPASELVSARHPPPVTVQLAAPSVFSVRAGTAAAPSAPSAVADRPADARVVVPAAPAHPVAPPSQSTEAPARPEPAASPSAGRAVASTS